MILDVSATREDQPGSAQGARWPKSLVPSAGKTVCRLQKSHPRRVFATRCPATSTRFLPRCASDATHSICFVATNPPTRFACSTFRCTRCRVSTGKQHLSLFYEHFEIHTAERILAEIDGQYGQSYRRQPSLSNSICVSIVTMCATRKTSKTCL